MQSLECKCECGTVNITVTGKPLLRGCCHCTICQEYNQAAYGDVIAFHSDDVAVNDKSNIAFKTYKEPPAVPRGKCKQCDTPIMEFVRAPGLPGITLLPRSGFAADAAVPESFGHIFYHSRVTDVDDTLPKYSGFVKSQWAFMKPLFISLAKRKLGR